MFQKVRLRLLMSNVSIVAWTVGPSVLWSFVFHNVLFCLDPLLLYRMERVSPLWLGIALRVFWVFGFSVALLVAWNITPGSYLFYAREALPFSPASVLVSLAVVVLFLFWFVFYRGTAHQSESLSRTIFLFGLLLLVLKSLSVAGWVQIPWVEQIRSPMIGVGRMLFSMKNDPAATVNAAPGATFNSFVRAQQTLPPKIVVMIVESWGERADALKQISSGIENEKFRVLTSGFTTYRGSTLSGEFRELCSKYLMPTDELKGGTSDLDCAPEFLHRQGYKISGLHGYERSFYARATFWNRFGITNKFFREDLPGLEHCPGPFDGTCDTALVKRGIEVLDREVGPNVVYLLTLSSHEPLEPIALQQPSAFFRDVNVVHPTQVVTRRAISDLMVELKRKQNRPCTLVYIAGDHQPPSASSKGGIFENNQVPFLSFTYNCPQELHTNSPTLAGR
jgi:hypothetical protein